ncbi:gliding motility-associated C-terminal domain-containing protein [Pontibacter akesuensis]|nr:gliding motility-associated C-terminal domain-containing protein [Pontibacter akesuensis]
MNLRICSLIIFLLFPLFSDSSNLIAQDNGWLKRYGSSETNNFSSSLLTPAGDVILTGYFTGGEGRMLLGNVELVSHAPKEKSCGFIAKVNRSGETVWAQTLQSTFGGVLHTATLDTKGNIYVMGNFIGELTYGSQKYVSFPNTPQSFLAKYDPEGRPLWVWMAPASIYFNAFNAVAADPLNNIYFAYNESQTIYSDRLGYNLKLAKLDVNGNLLSDQLIAESVHSIGCTSIKFNTQLQPVLLGSYKDKIVIGSQEHASPNTFNMFLLKSTTNGIPLWSIDIGKNAHTLSGSSELALDDANNIYVAGSFSDSPAKVTVLKKFNLNGRLIWQYTLDRELVPYLGGLAGTSLKITSSHHIILTGFFSGDVSFGSTRFKTQFPEYTDLFVTKITKDGQVAGAIRSDAKGAVNPMSILINNMGDFYVSGSFVSDNFVFQNSTSKQSGNFYDIFLLKGSLAALETNEIPEEIEENNSPALIIPNIITPNGDGKNDAFVINTLQQDTENLILIYNRWGKLVYQSKSYQNDWSAAGLPNGSYFYVLQHLKTNRQYKGWVEVMR